MPTRRTSIVPALNDGSLSTDERIDIRHENAEVEETQNHSECNEAEQTAPAAISPPDGIIGGWLNSQEG